MCYREIVGEGWKCILSSVPVSIAFRIVISGGFLELDVGQHVPHGRHEPVYTLVQLLPCSSLVVPIMPDIPLQENGAGETKLLPKSHGAAPQADIQVLPVPGATPSAVEAPAAASSSGLPTPTCRLKFGSRERKKRDKVLS